MRGAKPGLGRFFLTSFSKVTKGDALPAFILQPVDVLDAQFC